MLLSSVEYFLKAVSVLVWTASLMAGLSLTPANLHREKTIYHVIVNSACTDLAIKSSAVIDDGILGTTV